MIIKPQDPTEIYSNMENYQGDLADIIRTGHSGGPINGTLDTATTSSGGHHITDRWQFQSDQMMYHPSATANDFGHPFLVPDLDISGGGSSFFRSTNRLEDGTPVFSEVANKFINSNNSNLDHQEIKKPAGNSTTLSRLLQISPNNNINATSSSPRLLLKGPPPPPPPTTTSTSNSKSGGCFIENSGGRLQISSPPNTGIKRRKSQAKKVVCIPAPTPANSRPTGEIVPSDLWAWRKYGQKPIKGSPFPRGYYRCSSSKGCSARKQVERSRTDPNMLVITYASEHNHPWPTQRNALAGSYRTQPPKNSLSSPKSQKDPTTTSKESQEKEISTNVNADNMSSTSIVAMENSTVVKEEGLMNDDEKEAEMEDGDQFSSEGFPPNFESYKPAILMDSINIDHHLDQDFFAELGEIQSCDPLNLLFTQGLISGDDEEEDKESNKDSLDPFTFYDWTRNSNTFDDQVKGGL